MMRILNNRQLFTVFGLLIIGLGFLGIILTILGMFYTSFFLVYILVVASFFLYCSIRQRPKLDAKLIFIVLISLGFILLFSIYTTPTIFSGRDQGSYSEAAIRLAQNHQLEFSMPVSEEFFKIYGPGKALNFPGFNYTKSGNLTTQFPLGYTSWLGIFYSLFDLSGLVIANTVSFFIFLLSFYLLSRLYLKPFPALTSYFLLLTSFIFSWFFKFTLSENLTLALLWFGILELIWFLEKKEKIHFLAALLSLILLAFTRIEALAFLVSAILILYFYEFRKLPKLAELVKKNKFLWITLGLAFALYLINLKVNSAFYIAFAKGFLNSFSSFGFGNIENKENFGRYLLPSLFYISKALLVYTLLNFLVFGFLGIIILFKKKKYSVLIPFFITLPAFIYLLNPSISPDHPWMLRRLVFAVIPISILYTVWFLDYFFKRRLVFYAVIFILLATNLIVFLNFITFSEHRNLLPQIKNISDDFTDSDLILIDRSATGDNWAMMSGPMSFLYGKQAVYFFNPEDLAKIDKSRFRNIYLIIPDNNLEFYKDSGENIIPWKDYSVQTEKLQVIFREKSEIYQLPAELPMKESVMTYGKIYLLK